MIRCGPAVGLDAREESVSVDRGKDWVAMPKRRFAGGGWRVGLCALGLVVGVASLPVIATAQSTVQSSTSEGRLGSANPEGLATTAPPAPVLGKSANVTPISGLVLIKLPSGTSPYGRSPRAASVTPTKGDGFIPLTEPRQVPVGTQIDATRGTLRLVAANGKPHRTQSARLFGGTFSISQTAAGPQKGLTTFTLKEGAFPGAPSFRNCTAKRAGPAGQSARIAALSSQVLETLRASDNHGRFRTRGRYSAATVRGTDWGVKDRCDGTLTLVHRGVVRVTVFATRKTVTVHAGHSFLAPAITG